MKRTKRFLSLILSLIMIISMAMPVMAASNSETYELKIEDTFSGHTYEAYQIFKGTFSTETNVLTNITWGDGVNLTPDTEVDFLNVLKQEPTFTTNGVNDFNVVDEKFIAQKVAKVIQDWKTFDNEKLQKFAEILHTYTKNEDGTYEYKYLSNTKYESTFNGSEQGAGGSMIYKYSIKGLNGGYYLIKDQDGSLESEHDYYTRLLLHVTSDVVIKPKGSVPTVAKSVNTSLDGNFSEHVDVAIGDTVYFRLDGTMSSHLNDYEMYKYEFVDTLSDGLDLEKCENNAFYKAIKELYIYNDKGANVTRTYYKIAANETEKNELLASGNKVLLLGTDVLVSYDDATRVFTITFPDLKTTFPNMLASDMLIVKYAAVLNKDAIIGAGKQVENNETPNITENEVAKGETGNENKVYINYSNNPQGDGTGKTEPDDAEVYTFELDIEKKDETGKNLGDAEFLLYQRVHKTSSQAEGTNVEQYDYYYAIAPKVSGTKNTYKITEWIKTSKAIAAMDADGYALDLDEKNVLNENGEKILLSNMIFKSMKDEIVDKTTISYPIQIQGLDATTYRLYEIKAPESYNRLEDSFAVTITATYDDSGSIITLAVDPLGNTDLTNGKVTIQVENNKGGVLPSTGGIGTTIFYTAGGILVAAAVVLMVTKKRMGSKEV